jgi:ribosome-binding protein aMBF1 (putative translation factor)
MQVRHKLARLRSHRLRLSEYVADLSDEWPGIIDTILERQGINQSELARKIGISVSYLSDIHTGRASLSERVETALVEEYCS